MNTLYNKIAAQPENGMTKQAWAFPLRMAGRAVTRMLPRLLPRFMSVGRTAAGRAATGASRKALSPGTLSDIALEAINTSPHTTNAMKDIWHGRGTFASNTGNLFKSIVQDGLNNMPGSDMSPIGLGDVLFDTIPDLWRNWNK